MHPDWIRFIGIAFNAIGSLVLAFRVTNILKALALVADIHDQNIDVAMRVDPFRTRVFLKEGPQQIKRAEKRSLLILGFVLIFVGLIAQGLATYLTLQPTNEKTSSSGQPSRISDEGTYGARISDNQSGSGN